MARPKKVENTTEYKVPAETVSGNGNGNELHESSSVETYEEFLDTLKDKGAIADGAAISHEGMMLLGQTAERRCRMR